MSKLTFDKFIEQMQAGKVFLGNPAMGSQNLVLLEGDNIPKGTLYANLSNREGVKRILKKHVGAGVDVLYANTFGADKTRFGKGEFAEAYRVGLDIAKTVAPDCLVIAPLGSPDFQPLLHHLENPRYERGKLRDTISTTYPNIESEVVKGLVEGCRERMQLSIENGADAIQLTTFTWSVGAECIYAAYETLDRKVPLLISFQLADEYDEPRTIWGDGIDGLFDLYADSSVIGYNCFPPEKMCKAIDVSNKRGSKPLMAFPSPGRTGQTGYRINTSDFAGEISDIIKAGARLVGACCGSTSKYTAAMRKVIDNYNAQL